MMNAQNFYNAELVYGDKKVATGVWATTKNEAWEKLYWKHENADSVKVFDLDQVEEENAEEATEEVPTSVKEIEETSERIKEYAVYTTQGVYAYGAYNANDAKRYATYAGHKVAKVTPYAEHEKQKVKEVSA